MRSAGVDSFIGQAIPWRTDHAVTVQEIAAARRIRPIVDLAGHWVEPVPGRRCGGIAVTPHAQVVGQAVLGREPEDEGQVIDLLDRPAHKTGILLKRVEFDLHQQGSGGAHDDQTPEPVATSVNLYLPLLSPKLTSGRLTGSRWTSP